MRLLAEKRDGCEGRKTGEGVAERRARRSLSFVGNLCWVRIEAKMAGTERLGSGASGLKRLAKA